MKNGLTLLAMPPSGEILMVRDEDGRTWLIQPPGAGATQRIDEDVARRAVAMHDFLWIDRRFPDWPSLDRFRQEKAAELTPVEPLDRTALDRRDVEQFLEVGRRWRIDGDLHRARKLARELLRLPAVLNDEALLEEVLAFNDEVTDLPALDVLASEPSSDEQAAARERYRAVAN